MPSTWKASLQRLLNQPRAESDATPRIAVLGVGNLFRSDDAAGILVARALSQRECAADPNHVLILEAGPAPENRTGELRKFAPDVILIADAADMGETPGAIRWIAEEEIDGMSASTHSLPLSMLIHYLRLELNCNVRILGIQVGSNEVGQNISPEVMQVVDEIVGEFDQAIQALSSRL